MSKFLYFFTFLLLAGSVFAQDPVEKTAEQIQRELKFAEQVLADADNLKLPENRALVFAQVGGFLCKTEAVRARELFQKAIGDLVVAQQQAAGIRKNVNAFEQLIYGQTPRLQILNAVAACDAELAIELLNKSRPAKISQMMAQISENEISYRQYYITAEISNEQRFINLAADQNPARAIELMRESLKNGVTYETMSLLQKILQKDEKAAGKFAEEIIQKLIETKLTVNDYQASSIIQYYLTEFGREKLPDEKSFKVSEASLRTLADNISAFWLENNYNNNYSIGTDGFKLIEKYFPARAAKLKNSRDQTGQQEYERYNKLIESNLPVDELLKQAESFQSYRTSVYNTAARKLGESGNLSQAVSLINSKFSEAESEQQISDLYNNLAYQEMSKGNFEEANRLINQIPSDQTRFNALLHLAQSIYQKNGEEDKRSALSIMNQAAALIDTSDLTEPEITNLVDLANVYSTIEPAEAFRTLEMIIPYLNDFIRAYAVVSGFRNEQIQRNGEFLITIDENFSGTNNLGNVVQNLKNKDFDQTIQLINGFERIEIRIGLKLDLIKSFSGSEIYLSENNFSMKRSG